MLFLRLARIHGKVANQVATHMANCTPYNVEAGRQRLSIRLRMETFTIINLSLLTSMTRFTLLVAGARMTGSMLDWR